MIPHQQNEEQSTEALKDLVFWRIPLDRAIENAPLIPSDYSGEPLVISRSDIEQILARFIDGRCSAQELERWADSIEMREDIGYKEGDVDFISTVLNEVSWPGGFGPITIESITELMKREYPS